MTDDERDTIQRARWAAQKRRQREKRSGRTAYMSSSNDAMIRAGWKKCKNGEWVPARRFPE